MERVSNVLAELDDLLRAVRSGPGGPASGPGGPASGPGASGAERWDAARLARMAALLAVSYGLFMGLFEVLRSGPLGLLQMAASMVKVPLLFLLTVLVTFPSLYVFTAMAGSRHGAASLLRVLVASITVNVAILASLGPITGFFSFTTTSYPFMKLLNVAFFVLSGAIGLEALRSVVLSGAQDGDGVEGGLQAGPPPAGPAQAGPAAVRRVVGLWLALYAFVGAQMAWVLRPLIGQPEGGFTLLSPRGGNAIADVFSAVSALFVG